MNWLAALALLLLQAPDTGGREDHLVVLTPSVGPELERIMAQKDLQALLGQGFAFGDARITPVSISIQVLREGQNAAVITLERPRIPAPGGWFEHRVEVLAGADPQLEAALMKAAEALDRGFTASPWSHPGHSASGPAPDGVPCAFCDLSIPDWPLHLVRHPVIPLCLGALIIIALGLGVYLGLRHSRALGRKLL